ncbi:MAG: ATP-grasp domain-containing protein [Labilithrix sp.]|nr:ATP-grasp domain-containing protein [Labilithrix sp.]
MKVLVLFDVDRAVDPNEGISIRALRREEQKPTEADVISCLRALGHDVDRLAVYDNVRDMFDRIASFNPDVVFNLCETFFFDRAHEPNIPAMLDLMKVKYTGAGPEALLLCKDKALCKKLLAFHGIRVAGDVVSTRARPLKKLRRFRFPAFVKPLGEEGSNGISKASYAPTEAEAIERANFIHERFNCDALIEEYIEGRELTVSVLGNPRPLPLPPRETFFGKADDDSAPRFATARAKWDDAYRRKWKIRNDAPDPFPNGAGERLARIARKAYRVLKVRGLVRLDVRLQEDGHVIVIEVNPNPSLARGDDFAASAAAAGLDYEALIQRILDNAVR